MCEGQVAASYQGYDRQPKARHHLYVMGHGEMWDCGPLTACQREKHAGDAEGGGGEDMNITTPPPEVVTVVKSIGWDECYAEWFVCPRCTEMDITDTFAFCPHCGSRLDWSAVLAKKSQRAGEKP